MAKDYKINISAHGAEKSQKQISGLTKGLGKMAVVGTAVVGSIKLLTAGFRAINDAMKKTAEMATASVNAYAKLEKGIAEIRTLTGGLGESVDVLREQMIEMGNATGQSFDVLTKAKYDIVSAGFGDAADSVLVFNESMKLAIGGVTDGATAVDLMTTALNSFNKDATQSADVSDVLFQTVKMGKTTIEELSSSFGRALPFAKSLGVTLEDTGTMMAFLTSKGINTAEATTSLSAMFRSLESPAQEAANMMAFYNIEVMRLEDGTVDLIGTLKQFEGMDAKIISKMIPEARAQLAIKSLSGDIGTLQEMISGMEQRGDAAKTAFDIMSQTWSFKFDQIKQKIQGVMAEIGRILTERFTPILDEVNEKLSKAFDIDFEKLAEAFGNDMTLLFEPLKKTARILGQMWVKTFVKMVKMLGPAMWEIFKEVLKAIGNILIDWNVWVNQNVWIPLAGFAEKALRKVVNWAILSVDKITLDFQTLPENFMKVWHKVVQLSNDAFDILIQAGKTGVSLLATIIKDIPNMVVMGFFGAVNMVNKIFADLKATTKTLVDSIALPFMYLRDVIQVVTTHAGAYIKKGFLTAINAVFPAIEKLAGFWDWIADNLGLETWKLNIDNTGIEKGIREADAIINQGLITRIGNKWEATNVAYANSVAEHWQEAEDTKVESEKKYQERIEPYLKDQEKLYDEHYAYVAKNHDKMLADMESNRETYEASIAPYNESIVQKAIEKMQTRVNKANEWIAENELKVGIDIEDVQMPLIETVEDIEGAFSYLNQQMNDATDEFVNAATDKRKDWYAEGAESLKELLGLTDQDQKTYLEEMASLLAELGLVWDETLDQWVKIAPKIIDDVEEGTEGAEESIEEFAKTLEYTFNNLTWLDNLKINLLAAFGDTANRIEPLINKVKQLFKQFTNLQPVQKFGNLMRTIFGPIIKEIEGLTDAFGKFGMEFTEFWNNPKTQMKIEGVMATIGSMNEMFNAQSEYINAEIAEGMNEIQERYDADSEALEAKQANDLEVFEASEEYKTATKARQKEMMEQFLKDQAQTEADLLAQKEKDEEDLNKKFAKEKLRIWKAEKVAKMAQAMINGAEAFTKALAVGPFAGPILAGGIAAMTAAQVGFIAKTKPPKFETGGFVGGKSHEAGGTIIEAEAGEFVVNKNSAQAFGYGRLERINKMRYGGKVKDYEAGGNVGGGTTVNVQFSGNVLSKNFIESEAIPAIRKAVKRGADIGI